MFNLQSDSLLGNDCPGVITTERFVKITSDTKISSGSYWEGRASLQRQFSYKYTKIWIGMQNKIAFIWTKMLLWQNALQTWAFLFLEIYVWYFHEIEQAEKLKSCEMKERWMKNDEEWWRMNEEGWRMRDEWWRMMISSCWGFWWQTDGLTNGHLWL